MTVPAIRHLYGILGMLFLAACSSPRPVSFADTGKAERRIELSSSSLFGSGSSVVEDQWLMFDSYKMVVSRGGGGRSVLISQEAYLLPEDVSRTFWEKVDRWRIATWTVDDLHVGCGGRNLAYRRGIKEIKLQSTSKILKEPLPEQSKFSALEQEIYELKAKGQLQPLTSLATRWSQPTAPPTKN